MSTCPSQNQHKYERQVCMIRYCHIQTHCGESRAFKTTTIADTIKNLVDSGNTFFDISVNTDQICVMFEADTPGK